MRKEILALSGIALVATPSHAQDMYKPSLAAGTKVRADLPSLMQPEAVFIAGGGLDNGYVQSRTYTRPSATRFPGLCRRNRVTMAYEGTDPANPGAPFSIFTETQYRVIQERVTIPGYGGDAPPFEPLKGPCATLDASGDHGWFTTDSPLGSGMAAFGYNDLAIAVATIREGKRGIPGCHDRKGQISYACNAFASSKFPDDVTWLNGCPSKAPDSCYIVGLENGYTVIIRLDYRGVDRDDVLRSVEIDENNEICV
ncbi:hypothetical protein OF829_18200 [Sphingomonas sp. LB-2]|uniref:hypothetical protein n=1 Tax=Sphingomonas caeni TaxID=2984949 RepID=UPI00222E558F|nr:hypothetical protein [Sphingomonas caeni]MCW3849175.1 hypothetical protein [Sphingomonas caeni]